MKAQASAERKNKAEMVKKGKDRGMPYTRGSEKEDGRSFKSGNCFNCGKRGHWADSCPEKNSKFSHLFYLSNTSYLNKVAQANTNTCNIMFTKITHKY